MAKILLINPPLQRHELYKRGAESTASIIPPLGLAYIGAVLERDGHKVEIIDGIALDISFEEVVNRGKLFDLIGITVLSAFFKRCAELIKALKKVTNVPIVAGGVHATVMPLSLLECGADYIVIGEGEETMRELTTVLQNGSVSDIDKVKGIAFMRNGEMRKTEMRPLIKNLDSLPLPARHLLPMHKYKTSEARTRRNPCHSMVVSRGCPGRCTFCNKSTFGVRFRINSPERIVEEMFVLRDQYQAAEIAFLDDNFTTNKKIVYAVCQALIDRKFDLHWSVEARIDNVDEAMLKIMKQAGCEFIAYGIESGSDDVLGGINKRISTQDIEKVIRMTKKIGLLIRGYFMLGFLGETEDQMYQTIEFASRLPLDVASFSLLVPFPGTEDYIKAQEEGGGFDPDFFYKSILPEFNFLEKPIYCPKGISPERLIEIHREAYKRFYYSPSFIFQQILNVKNWDDVKRLIRGALTLIKN
ncbi:MAG: radical SAM protein [Nitrospirae bacterium]|nr:radical SAM protein [Nitrospirota bacterium]